MAGILRDSVPGYESPTGRALDRVLERRHATHEALVAAARAARGKYGPVEDDSARTPHTAA